MLLANTGVLPAVLITIRMAACVLAVGVQVIDCSFMPEFAPAYICMLAGNCTVVLVPITLNMLACNVATTLLAPVKLPVMLPSV